MVRLSALVCVQNQDAQLSRCLRRLSFCDEIVVVADRCTDRSQEIARRHGATVVDGIFPLESQRKAAGLAACTGDWILELEPEDEVDSALAWEIRAALQLRPQGDWFEIPVEAYVGDAPVRRGWTAPFGAPQEARLYKPEVKQWRARRLDAGEMVNGTSAGALKGALRRTTGEDIGALTERLNRLAGLRAEDLADAGQSGALGGALLAAAGTFLHGYAARGGWREGRMGLLVALLAALHPVLAQMRAREILAGRQTAAEAPAPRLRQVVGLSTR